LLDADRLEDQIAGMATKQTRRSISVRGATYETLRRYCENQNRSMSDIVEEQLARLFEGQRNPQKRTVANKILRRADGSVGRPAPTPIEEVVEPRVQAPKGDYRAIRF
jgi:hypothetical protein